MNRPSSSGDANRRDEAVNTNSTTRQKFLPDAAERAVRVVREARENQPSEWAANCAIAANLGCSSETPRKRLQQAERDSGEWAAPVADDRQGLNDLEHENRELPGANEIPRKASAFFTATELGRRFRGRAPVSFIDEHRHVHGVEPMCSVLPIAPSTHNARPPQRRDRLAGRHACSGTRYSGRPSGTPGRPVGNSTVGAGSGASCCGRPPRSSASTARWAPCPVERHIRQDGLAGVVRGRGVRTTVPADVADRPLGGVKRDFSVPEPNRLRVADFTCGATWAGVVHVAFVIDVFSRFIVGWHMTGAAPA